MKYRDIKIDVSDLTEEQRADVQCKLFADGCKWAHCDTSVIDVTFQYLFVDYAGVITLCNSPSLFNLIPHTEISPREMIDSPKNWCELIAEQRAELDRHRKSNKIGERENIAPSRLVDLPRVAMFQPTEWGAVVTCENLIQQEARASAEQHSDLSLRNYQNESLKLSAVDKAMQEVGMSSSKPNVALRGYQKAKLDENIDMYATDGDCDSEDDEDAISIRYLPEQDNSKSGGSANYYRVQVDNPITIKDPYMAECNDIMESLKLDPNEVNVFKELWRMANARNGNGKEGNTDKRAAEKILWFACRSAILAGVDVKKLLSPQLDK